MRVEPNPAAGAAAIIGGFLVSLFGGSRVQIGGPTGAFVVIIAGIIVGLTGIGAVVGLILGILGVLVGLAAWWHSQKFKADEQIAKCVEASADAVKAMESLGKLQP